MNNVVYFPSGAAAHPLDAPLPAETAPALADETRPVLAGWLSEIGLALRIAARRQREKPAPQPLQMGEKVLFTWPSGGRNRQNFGPSGPQARTGVRSEGRTREAGSEEATRGCVEHHSRLTTGIVTGWIFGAACEEERRYFIQLTDGPDAGTRICHARKGLVTVFPQEDLRRTAPQARPGARSFSEDRPNGCEGGQEQ